MEISPIGPQSNPLQSSMFARFLNLVLIPIYLDSKLNFVQSRISAILALDPLSNEIKFDFYYLRSFDVV